MRATSLFLLFAVAAAGLLAVTAASQLPPVEIESYESDESDEFETASVVDTFASFDGSSSDEDDDDDTGRDTRYAYKSVCLDDDDQPTLVDAAKCRRQVALGRFSNAINSTGWGGVSTARRDRRSPL